MSVNGSNKGLLREDFLGGAKLIETVMIPAEKLEIDVIAEGIEIPEQLHGLTALGCEFGQGFLFAPPLEAEAASRFVAEGGARSLNRRPQPLIADSSAPHERQAARQTLYFATTPYR